MRGPRHTFPRAILRGGTLCFIGYVGATMMAAVRGMMQAGGKTSAACILFVSGPDRYFSSGLDKVHPRNGSPWLRRAFSDSYRPLGFETLRLRIASVAGISMTAPGFLMAFVPSRQISSIGSASTRAPDPKRSPQRIAAL